MSRSLTILPTALFLAGTLIFGGCREQANNSGDWAGDPGSIGTGQFTGFVTLDDGDMTRIGIRIDADALDGLPNEMRNVNLNLPANAAHAPYQHLAVDWNPMGHPPPGIYDAPHFDFHFYMIDETARMAIDPADTSFARKGAHMPDAAYIPGGYFSPPGNETVPFMGTHLFNGDAPELHGAPFESTFIWGFYDGQILFAEPMITKAFLESLKATPGRIFSWPITEAAKVQTRGFYPRRYSVSYDPVHDQYVVSLDDLRYRR